MLCVKGRKKPGVQYIVASWYNLGFVDGGSWRLGTVGLNDVLGKGFRQSYIQDIQSYQSRVSMKEFFTNPVWITALIASLTFMGWLIKAFLDRKRPALGKEIEQSIPVLRPEAETTPELILTYAGEAIWEAHLVILKIKNTGNISISVEDFEKNIGISTGGVDVLDAEVIDKTPDELDPKVRFANDGIEIIPLLLNPNDEFRLKILLRQPPKKLVVRSRIKAIKEITEIGDRSKKWFIGALVFTSISFAWTMLTYSKSINAPILLNAYNQPITQALMAMLMIIALIIMVRFIKYRFLKS